MRTRRFILITVAAVYFGSLVGLAFVPESPSNRAVGFWALVAFVPVGVLLLLLLGRRRWWAAIAFSVLGAAWIEAAQTVWMPVGYAEVTDVAWASSGAIVGVLIAIVVTRPRTTPWRERRTPRIVASTARNEVPQD